MLIFCSGRKYKGMWHIFHQANWTDWAHLVSTDLVRWSRLPSALSPNGDWDGSLTVLNGVPVIMYDCYNVPDCHPINTTGPGLGDPRIIGVAHPANLSDPNLTKWKKDPNNPISINNGESFLKVVRCAVASDAMNSHPQFVRVRLCYHMGSRYDCFCGAV